ncbi:MAG: toast rack family protein [Chloroflexi bacterium]|nr:toast rack family protein [Chloroflexota bacterium]MCL5275248.1 toast rack family protein [Chloroflexota bacterium]
MKPTKLLAGTCVVVITVALTACNITINPVTTGALQTYKINVPRPTDLSQTWDVELDVGSAGTSVGVGADGLVNGTVEYNVNDWKPMVINSNNAVQIRQKDFNGIPPLNAQNDWRLKLGQGVPMALTVRGGAMKGEWELGGLSLVKFDWQQGAADTTIRFSAANPANMDSFKIDAGASTLKVFGLANTNAQTATLNIGAGSLNLRMDGKLARDLYLTLEGGAAAIIVDSGGNPVQVVVGQSLTAVTSGDWSSDGDTYTSPEWTKKASPKITVQAKMGASTLNLVSGQ